MRIQRLPTSVANQIAAGEVIERPASVVKELLENALDAGATAIHIELGFGGLNLIKVSDNGQGIDAEDLPLAIAAHATSKISQLSDLYAITTMGFRGEALASIASVAKMAIYSKTAHQAHASVLRQQDTDYFVEPCARTQGTTIEVKDLFYNIPVRKSFLKSERMEYQAIELVVKQFAMAAPEITISLQHNQKQMLHLPSANCESGRLRRIKKLFGQAFLNDAILVQEDDAEFKMQGWISRSDYQRSQRDKQWVYLNNRLIKDKLILQAIGQVYQEILHPGRYASCVLYLTVPPDQVDVNVHPTKHEVRFRDPRMIHARLVGGLSKYLHPCGLSDTKINGIFQPTQKEGATKTPTLTQESNAPWIILNTQFVLIRTQDAQPFLLDIAKVYQHYVAAILHSLEFPFPQRSLLVPIRIAIETQEAYSHLEQQRPILLDLGFQFDFVSTQHMLLRAMPMNLPLLDLQTFFKTIQMGHHDQTSLIKGLIACQATDAYNMSTIDRDMITDYSIQHWDSLLKMKACLAMDIRACQQFIDHYVVDCI